MSCVNLLVLASDRGAPVGCNLVVNHYVMTGRFRLRLIFDTAFLELTMVFQALSTLHSE